MMTTELACEHIYLHRMQLHEVYVIGLRAQEKACTLSVIQNYVVQLLKQCFDILNAT